MGHYGSFFRTPDVEPHPVPHEKLARAIFTRALEDIERLDRLKRKAIHSSKQSHSTGIDYYGRDAVVFLFGRENATRDLWVNAANVDLGIIRTVLRRRYSWIAEIINQGGNTCQQN